MAGELRRKLGAFCHRDASAVPSPHLVYCPAVPGLPDRHLIVPSGDSPPPFLQIVQCGGDE